MNKVIARFVDGRILKGTTADFVPAKDRFHLSVTGGAAGNKPTQVLTASLKALFFVRDFDGNSQHVERNEFDSGRPAPGRKIKVIFSDGEVLVGTTQGYQPGRPGFFLVPADLESNTERCYVVTAAAAEIEYL